MSVTPEDRRHFIALACKVAWADGVVTDEEREFVRGLVQRLGGKAIGEPEMEAWLADGVPEQELEALPEGLGQLFVYEAMKLMEVDGDIDRAEMEMIEQLMGRVFKSREAETPLARIALKRRS